jgi:hypothetical protein
MQFEFAICEALVLVVLVYEWFSIRRTLRRDREARAKRDGSNVLAAAGEK